MCANSLKKRSYVDSGGFWSTIRSLVHAKALVFLYAFEESVDYLLLSFYCDDSNLHIILFKYVLSTMGVSKESISKFFY